MVSIVLVSHSLELSMAVKALAEQQVQGRAVIAAVGGSENPYQPFGTDPVAIAEAIEAVGNDDGVLVLMDLGSAVISGQVALELLPPELRARVRICSGPFVEGAMAAAVQASIGMDLEAVAREAEEAMQAKIAVLRPAEEAAPSSHSPAVAGAKDVATLDSAGADVLVVNPAGLHFGPAARFVQLAAQFQAEICVTNLSTGAGPAPASRLNRLLALGIEKGHLIRIEASGQDAEAAVDLLARQVAHDVARYAYVEVSPLVSPSSFDIEENGVALLWGQPASPGMAVGDAVVLAGPHLLPTAPDDRRSIVSSDLQPESDLQQEWERLEAALQIARSQLETLIAQVRTTLGEEQALIFHAHLLLLEDQDFLEEMRAAIRGGASAAQATQTVVAQWAQRFRRMSGAIFQQRSVDIEDVGSRLLQSLGVYEPQAIELPERAIVVAETLLPSQAAMLDHRRVIGICTAGGGAMAHAIILARSMGIPAIVNVGPLLLETVKSGARLAVDGARGLIVVEPDESTQAMYAAAHLEATTARAVAWAHAQQLTRTADGVRVEVAANLGTVDDAERALEAGAEAVGLLRTEFLFQDRRTPPDEMEQAEIYTRLARIMADRRTVVRTFDIGGDKPAPYLSLPAEANPFLGWRAIRISLTMPEFFKAQLRALMRAAVEGNIHILLPMISTMNEVLHVQALLAAAAGELKAAGASFRADVPIGVMIETPAAVEMADRLAALVDFFSLGTNDLVQYTFAADRTNERVANLYDPLHPAVLRQIDRVLRAAHLQKRWVGLCGEMAADPLAIPILLGLGLDEFSMAPASIPIAKQIIGRLTMPAARRLAQKALQMNDGDGVRNLVRKTMEGIDVI
ncbi:MAG: phosphoenolpyruvate--protein phosphotransferase [Caldilinea sp.]|nr:phosphoenolpyruvate--protein phosphotransferase [Caldilinea sp.]MDW8440809.1 phosphoenolpyruvate--protein phosphotransferase [Caldilineaceae bacterium]